MKSFLKWNMNRIWAELIFELGKVTITIITVEWFASCSPYSLLSASISAQKFGCHARKVNEIMKSDSLCEKVLILARQWNFSSTHWSSRRFTLRIIIYIQANETTEIKNLFLFTKPISPDEGGKHTWAQQETKTSNNRNTFCFRGNKSLKFYNFWAKCSIANSVSPSLQYFFSRRDQKELS